MATATRTRQWVATETIERRGGPAKNEAQTWFGESLKIDAATRTEAEQIAAAHFAGRTYQVTQAK